MNILLRVVALIFICSGYFSVTYALEEGGASDNYEREADRVANRPSPMMRKGKQNMKMQKGKAATSVKRQQSTKMQKRITGKTATSVTGQVNTGAGARAINRDECNPLCGMKGVGIEKSQPAR